MDTLKKRSSLISLPRSSSTLSICSLPRTNSSCSLPRKGSLEDILNYSNFLEEQSASSSLLNGDTPGTPIALNNVSEGGQNGGSSSGNGGVDGVSHSHHGGSHGGSHHHHGGMLRNSSSSSSLNNFLLNKDLGMMPRNPSFSSFLVDSFSSPYVQDLQRYNEVTMLDSAASASSASASASGVSNSSSSSSQGSYQQQTGASPLRPIMTIMKEETPQYLPANMNSHHHHHHSQPLPSIYSSHHDHMMIKEDTYSDNKAYVQKTNMVVVSYEFLFY